MANNNQSNYTNQVQLQQQYQYQQQQQLIQQNMQPNKQIVQQQQQVEQNKISTSNLHLALLGLADSFQKNNQFRLAIHCLESILTLKHTDISLNMNFHIQLRTRISLCRLYLKHTLNTNQYVNAHLEKSIILVQNLSPNDEYKYEATYLIYKIFQKQKSIQLQLKQSGNNDMSQQISLFNLELIKKILETSATNHPVWHLRLLFLISDILAHDRDFINSAYFMSIGVDYCAQNRTRIPTYTYILFILSKGLIHLLQRNPAELQTTMQPCASLIESYQTANLNQIESLKIFFLVLQVTYFIQCGQMKSVKNTLKNLQHYVQSLAGRSEQEDINLVSSNQLENFQWLHKDHLGILVYLLTVIHSVQTGSYDKAIKLIDKALLNVHKLKLKEQTLSNQASSYNVSFVTNAFHFMLIENMSKCNITIGNRCLAIQKIGDLFQLCDSDSRLMCSFSPQLHCLCGLYCLSVNLKEQALSHFNQSLKTTNDTDLWLFNAMNSALCYLNSMSTNQNIKNQLMSIMDNLMPENIQTQNSALTSLSHYFRALKYFLNGEYQQAKLSLKEAILLANAEELMCIVANACILMGHSDFLMSQFQESFDELNNGSDLSEKLSDYNLKIYSNTLLRDMFKYFNDPREGEIIRKFTDLEQKLSSDYYEALKTPQHALIEWNSNISPTNIIANIKRIQQQASMNQIQHQQSPVEQPPQQHNSPNQIQTNLSTQSPILHQQQQQQQHTPQHQYHHHQPQQQQQHTPTYNNYTQHNNSPIHQQQQMLQAQQRHNIMSPQQQYLIQQQQHNNNKMSPHQPQTNSQNYNYNQYQQVQFQQPHHQHHYNQNHHHQQQQQQQNQQHLMYNQHQQQQTSHHHHHHHH